MKTQPENDNSTAPRLLAQPLSSRDLERVPLSGHWFSRQLRAVGELPCRAVAQQPLNQRRVHRMTCPLRHHPAPYPPSRKSEIANQIQNLVPHKLIVEP